MLAEFYFSESNSSIQSELFKLDIKLFCIKWCKLWLTLRQVKLRQVDHVFGVSQRVSDMS